MKTLAAYLERAITLEEMAASENDTERKANLRGLAEAYRKAAALRSEHLNLQNPPKSRAKLRSEEESSHGKSIHWGRLRGGDA